MNQIGFVELIRMLRKHLGLMIALPLTCAVAMGAYAYLVMDDTFTATASMYVLAQGEEYGSSANLSSDLSASQMISNDVSALLTSDRVLDETVADLGLEDLGDYDISVTSETTSRVIGLSVTGPDAQMAADIANDMVSNVSQIAREVMNIESVNAIDRAKVAAVPSGPNRILYTAVAFVAGLLAAVAIVLMADMFNTKVRTQDDVETLLGMRVIGRIPTMVEGR